MSGSNKFHTKAQRPRRGVGDLEISIFKGILFLWTRFLILEKPFVSLVALCGKRIVSAIERERAKIAELKREVESRQVGVENLGKAILQEAFG